MSHSLARRAVWAMWGNTTGVRKKKKKKRPAKAHIGIRGPYIVHEVIHVVLHSQGGPDARHCAAWNAYCWSLQLTNIALDMSLNIDRSGLHPHVYIP